MKRSILRALALCLATAVVSGTAWAQDDQNKSTSNQGAPPGTSPVGLGTQSGSLSSQSSQAFRLSRLMNSSLRSQTGENLGQVQDIILDPTSGQIQFVVLQLNSSATGAPGATSARTSGIGTTSDSSVSNPRPAPSTTGSFGTGSGRLVAVPWRLLNRGAGDQFTSNLDRTRLESAPTFSSMTWPTMDSAWMQSVYSHFGTTPPAGTGAPGSSSGTGTGTGTSPGTGLGNPSTPGVPSTPGTPDINPPGTGTTPGTPAPGTAPATGTVK
jgi:sporulation protein YlmC with PRC-barrel domain